MSQDILLSFLGQRTKLISYNYVVFKLMFCLIGYDFMCNLFYKTMLEKMYLVYLWGKSYTMFGVYVGSLPIKLKKHRTCIYPQVNVLLY